MPANPSVPQPVRQQDAADLAAARATQMGGMAVALDPRHARVWLRLNGHVAAVFTYASNANDPWTYRFAYRESLADAELIMFVDQCDAQPRFHVIPVSSYQEIERWDPSEWLERWDLVPAS